MLFAVPITSLLVALLVDGGQGRGYDELLRKVRAVLRDHLRLHREWFIEWPSDRTILEFEDYYTDRMKELHGVDVLGWGGFRVTLRIAPGHVIKLPIHEWGPMMNLSEFEVWESADHRARRHLADVMAADDDGWWIVMKEADRIREWLDPMRLVPAMRAIEVGVPGKHMGWADDLDFDNSGLLEGRLVVVDYPLTTRLSTYELAQEPASEELEDMVERKLVELQL